MTEQDLVGKDDVNISNGQTTIIRIGDPVYSIIRTWLFDQYLGSCDTVTETAKKHNIVWTIDHNSSIFLLPDQMISYIIMCQR